MRVGGGGYSSEGRRCGGYMGEGMRVEGTWVRVGGGGYTRVRVVGGGGGVHLQHVQNTNAEVQKKFFTIFFISLRQSGWF